MNERDKVRLGNMLDEARHAQHFMSGKTQADLEQDELLSHAVVRALEIIGEAASRVTSETREEYPQIPWKSVVGMRNRIIHDYTNVNLDIVWETVTQSIPELVQVLEIILRATEGDES